MNTKRMMSIVALAGVLFLVGGLVFLGCQSSTTSSSSTSTAYSATTVSTPSTAYSPGTATTTTYSSSTTMFTPSTLSSSTEAQSSTTGAASLASIGKIIYVYGTDTGGTPIPRTGGFGMMGEAGCITCHGSNGRGGTVTYMMGQFQVPDIRWSTISQPMQMGGKTEPPYTPATFARAVRNGIGSDGDELEAPMPQWQLTDAQVDALIAYLKTL